VGEVTTIKIRKDVRNLLFRLKKEEEAQRLREVTYNELIRWMVKVYREHKSGNVTRR